MDNHGGELVSLSIVNKAQEDIPEKDYVTVYVNISQIYILYLMES